MIFCGEGGHCCSPCSRCSKAKRREVEEKALRERCLFGVWSLVDWDIHALPRHWLLPLCPVDVTLRCDWPSSSLTLALHYTKLHITLHTTSGRYYKFYLMFSQILAYLFYRKCLYHLPLQVRSMLTSWWYLPRLELLHVIFLDTSQKCLRTLKALVALIEVSKPNVTEGYGK